MEIEIRSNGSVRLTGYVNAVERDSRVLPKRMAKNAPGDFMERVTAGAFARAISRSKDIRMMLNHERDIGGTGTGEIKLTEDAIGLRADAEITDSEVRMLAEQGKLRGWSFGFTQPKDDYADAGNGIYRRSLSDFDLVEVSILTKMPAYFGTSVEIRAADTAEEIERRAVDDAPEVTIQPAENHTQEINSYRKIIAALCCE